MYLSVGFTCVSLLWFVYICGFETINLTPTCLSSCLEGSFKSNKRSVRLSSCTVFESELDWLPRSMSTQWLISDCSSPVLYQNDVLTCYQYTVDGLISLLLSHDCPAVLAVKVKLASCNRRCRYPNLCNHCSPISGSIYNVSSLCVSQYVLFV